MCDEYFHFRGYSHIHEVVGMNLHLFKNHCKVWYFVVGGGEVGKGDHQEVRFVSVLMGGVIQLPITFLICRTLNTNCSGATREMWVYMTHTL